MIGGAALNGCRDRRSDRGVYLDFQGFQGLQSRKFYGGYSGMGEVIDFNIDDYSDAEYLKHKIDSAITEFCEEYEIENLVKESQNRFNACLRYIYNHVFKASNKYSLDNRSKTLLDINNIKLVYEILSYYIYLCDLYSKAISINGFSVMSGIDRTIIYDWFNGVNRLNSGYSDIFKTLDAERERSLADLLISGNRPNIGILAVLNHEKGWNLPGASREVKHVVTSETPQQIAERYRARLADNAENADN